MGGFRRFIGKELVEIARTWRLPVVVGVLLFFALTGPFLALMTPELLKSMQASQPGVVIQLPDPTWRDAYAQWVKNLSQIAPFIVLVLGAGSVAGEVASGTSTLVLTKPVSRVGFVVAKVVANSLLIIGVVLLSTALTQLLTLVVFDSAPAGPLWKAVGAWLSYAVFLLAVGTVFSAVVSTLAAVGAGIGVFFVVSLLALWGPAVSYSPAGVLPVVGDVLAGRPTEPFWPVVTSLAAAVALVALAAGLFSRREL